MLPFQGGENPIRPPAPCPPHSLLTPSLRRLCAQPESQPTGAPLGWSWVSAQRQSSHPCPLPVGLHPPAQASRPFPGLQVSDVFPIMCQSEILPRWNTENVVEGNVSETGFSVKVDSAFWNEERGWDTGEGPALPAARLSSNGTKLTGTQRKQDPLSI